MVKKRLFFQGREFIIEECENGDIIIDNIRYRPEVKKGTKNTYRVKLNKRAYNIEIADGKFFLDGTVVKVAVRPYIELKDEKGSEPIAKEQYISAPIPGFISQILVKQGDIVEKNQELVILEAMKMRNRLLSPINGKIEDILVKQNDNVKQDQKLIKVVPAAQK